MTPRQARFVDEYLIDLNATQAAMRAGYSKKTAEAQGSRLLRNVKVAGAISLAIEQRSQRTAVTADQVLEELRRVAFADIRSIVHWGPDGVRLVPADMVPDSAAAMISEVSQTSTGELKVKMHSKLTALHDLGKHLGLFIDKSEITVLSKPFSEWSIEEKIAVRDAIQEHYGNGSGQADH